MADDYGLSFSPLTQGQNRTGQASPSGGGSQNPVQDAIRTLSYRVPRTVGAQSPIPQALLSAPGGQGLPQSSLPGTQAQPSLGLEDILRKLFGLTPQASPMAPPPEAGGASPMFDPGIGLAPMGGTAQSLQGVMGGQSQAPAPRFTPGIGSGDVGPLEVGQPQADPFPFDKAPEPGIFDQQHMNGEFQIGGSGFPSPGRGAGAPHVGRAVRR